MFKIAESIPVRTRLPAAAWVIAGVVRSGFVRYDRGSHRARTYAYTAHAVHDSVPASQVWASVW